MRPNVLCSLNWHSSSSNFSADVISSCARHSSSFSICHPTIARLSWPRGLTNGINSAPPKPSPVSHHIVICGRCTGSMHVIHRVRSVLPQSRMDNLSEPKLLFTNMRSAVNNNRCDDCRQQPHSPLRKPNMKWRCIIFAGPIDHRQQHGLMIAGGSIDSLHWRIIMCFTVAVLCETMSTLLHCCQPSLPTICDG